MSIARLPTAPATSPRPIAPSGVPTVFRLRSLQELIGAVQDWFKVVLLSQARERGFGAPQGSSRGCGPDQGVPGRAEQSAGGAVQAQPFADLGAAGQRAGPGGRHYVAVGDQRVDRVVDHRAGLLDRVLVIVTRSARATPGRRVAIVEIVGRDDLVEILRAAVGVAVEELTHDLFRAQLGAHRSFPLTAGTAGSSRAMMLGRVFMPMVPFVPGLARAPRASG